MEPISPGMTVLATDAFGDEHKMEALSAVEIEGHDFPVVWVRPTDNGNERIPWPVEAVRPA